MTRLEVGEFLEIKDYFEVSGDSVPISYCMVLSIDGDRVEMGFYDEKRLSVGTEIMRKQEIVTSDKISNTEKEPSEIAWEFRKELE